MSVLVMYKKWMGTALLKLKKSGIEDEKGQLVKFKGSLTDNAITALNIYYGGAIETTKMTLMGWYKLQMPNFYIPCLQMNTRAY